MKLPEPVGWSYLFEDDGSLCQQFDTREEADRWVDSPDCLWAGYVSPLYSESQVKELIAERDAVLKMALDALEVSWKTDEGEAAAIQVIRKLLNEPQSTHTAR